MNGGRRIFKKIFIAVIYLAIFTGLGAGGYFLFRPKSPLNSVPAPVIVPIEVIWSQVFDAGSGLYSVAAKIRNPNTNFGASDFNYSFYFYDANEVLLTTSTGLSAQTGRSFIWPGESKYVILSGISLTKAPTKTLLKIEEPTWRKVENFNGVDLILSNINFGKGKAGSGKFFSIDFTANNNTPYDLDKVYVSAVVLDKNNLLIAAASTLLENLKSKEHRSFNIPWFSSFLGTPNGVDLSISTNLWEKPELLGQ